MSITIDDGQDPNYLALPDTLKQLVDAAFGSALGGADSHLQPTRDEPMRKRRRIAEQTAESQPGSFIIENNDIEPGGFLIDDPPSAGGLIPPSPSPQSPPPTQIPLSLIPAALARLDLAPDDEDVLAVFRNAASGWSNSHQNPTSQTEGTVSRKDFRAVCAVLLDSDAPPSPPSRSSNSAAPMCEGGGFLIEDEGEGGFIPTASASDVSLSHNPEFVFDDSGEDSDAYQELDSDPDDNGDESADEYIEGPRPGPSFRPSKSARKSRKALCSDDDEIMDDSSRKHKPLSSHQKKESRIAFGLFFPDVTDNKLDEQRIMIRDIMRVTELLKDKIKAEEVCLHI